MEEKTTILDAPTAEALEDAYQTLQRKATAFQALQKLVGAGGTLQRIGEGVWAVTRGKEAPHA